MMHRHHIIPKHFGGAEDESNIVLLTVEEHAESHRQLWLGFGSKKDWLAWQGLSKQIGKEEIIKRLCSHPGSEHPLYGVTGAAHPCYGMKRTQKTKDAISSALKNHKRTSTHTARLNSRFSESYLKNVAGRIARRWEVTYSDGTKEEIRNAAAFARTHKLVKSSISYSAQTGTSYKGMVFRKLGK